MGLYLRFLLTGSVILDMCFLFEPQFHHLGNGNSNSSPIGLL